MRLQLEVDSESEGEGCGSKGKDSSGDRVGRIVSVSARSQMSDRVTVTMTMDQPFQWSVSSALPLRCSSSPRHCSLTEERRLRMVGCLNGSLCSPWSPPLSVAASIADRRAAIASAACGWSLFHQRDRLCSRCVRRRCVADLGRRESRVAGRRRMKV